MSRIHRSNSNIRDAAASILHSHCLSPPSYLPPPINCSGVNQDMNNLMKRSANMTRNWNLSTVTWVRLKKTLQPHSSLWRLQLCLTPWPQPHERPWARATQLSHLHVLRIQEFSGVPIFFQKYCFPARQNPSPFLLLAAKNLTDATQYSRNQAQATLFHLDYCNSLRTLHLLFLLPEMLCLHLFSWLASWLS